MNPRIRECAIEAGLDSNYIEGFDSIYSKQLERFAELIVRDCAGVELYWLSEQNRKAVADKIKNHFGVEQ